MSITQTLRDDMKAAMRAREKERLGTIRLLLAALKNEQIAAKVDELDDDAALTVTTRQAKQRRESISEYEKGGREDLAAKERAELEIIAVYLPEPMPTDEVEALVKGIIAEVGASSPREMGAVMGKLMPQIKGRFDGKAAQQIVLGLLKSVPKK